LATVITPRSTLGLCLALAATGLPSVACGQVVTTVGEELPVDAGHEQSVVVDAAGDGGACPQDLSNIGMGDFRVEFAITTAQTQFAALVNQRAVCSHGGFWDVRMTSGGLFAVETDDGTSYTPLTTTGPRVNDGLSHDVRVQRVAGMLTVYLDGTPTGSASSPASFGQLAPLRTGTDVCTPTIDGTMTLAGTITDLCVTSP
jgi:hypothetical protein